MHYPPRQPKALWAGCAALLAACLSCRWTPAGSPRIRQFLWVMSAPEGSTDWWMSITEGAKTIVVIFHTPRVPCDAQLEDSQSVFVVDGASGSYSARPVKVPVGTEAP